MFRKNSFFNFYRSILFFLTGLSLGLGCHYPQKHSSSLPYDLRPPQNVLLISIDTLRADHLGCYGNSQVQTPNIDSLARQGIRFEWAFTPVPITLPSHASILTGLYPCTHGVLNNGEYRLNKATKTLAQILQQQGFYTAAFLGAFVLNKQFGLARGFDVYDDDLSPERKKSREAFSLYDERPGKKVTESALQWLKEKNPQRFFLWVHYFDPHHPYSPPSPFRDKYSACLYDGEIAYTDYCLGLLLQELEKQHILKDTLVVLVADHGESLGEHKESTHGIFLYDATVRVPLIMRYPDLPSGEICSHPVKTIDILPTVLDILKISPPDGLQGESLLAYCYRDDVSQREGHAIFLETRFPESNFGWSRLQGIRTRRWKYILAPRPELYDLKTDPGEQYNALDQYPEQARSLKETLQNFLDTLPMDQRDQSIPMDEVTRERLQSLGYVWTADSSAPSKFSPDPKDMIEVLNLFDQGSAQYVDKQYHAAISSFRLVIQQNPQNLLARFLLAAALEKVGNLEESLAEFQQVASQDSHFINVHNNIGNVYEKLGEYEKASQEYQTDIRLHPEVPLSYNNLGVIYLKQNRYPEAKEQFEKVLSLNPDRPTSIVAHANLGIACEMLSQYDQAQLEYQRSLELDPDYLAARMGAGNVFLKTRQPESAIREWQKALEIFPQNPEAHFNLGCTFLKLNRLDKAMNHLQEAIRLEPNLWQARLLLQKIQPQYTTH